MDIRNLFIYPCCMQDTEQPMYALLQTYHGIATLGTSVLAVLAMIPFLYMEVGIPCLFDNYNTLCLQP